ncbi:glycosyltransferase family 2 protein [Candidatus Saccharibacteria bacterium]|nr:MAG: glycosyltransferase family 2 protein [Candidatus Saccharibacteria bacterium]
MKNMTKSTSKPVVVIPNLNGGAELEKAVLSLKAQTLQPHIIVVDNASTDDSLAFLANHPEVELIRHTKNKGYAGGVNPGFQRAIELNAAYAAPLNDDAVADPRWLELLVRHLDTHPEVGAVASKVMKADKIHLDSTGDYYTVWGLPYPRGRDEVDEGQYDQLTDIFAASGASSLFRVAALKEVGLFDEDFFAYYEDVDLSFRLQLAGWKIAYVPESVVYHAIGMTSGRIKGFTTYQTMKNLPLLLRKNVPDRYQWRITWRLNLALILFFWRAVSRGHLWSAMKGDWASSRLSYMAGEKRRQIQSSRKVSDDYIWGMIVHDLPPNAHALRKLRSFWWKVRGKKT